MKGLLVVMSLAIHFVFADPWPPKLIVDNYAPAREFCRVKMGLSEDDLKQFEKGVDFETPEHKCFFYCYLDKRGDVNGNTLDPTNFLELLSQIPVEQQNILLQATRKCFGGKIKDMCAKVYAGYQCIRKTDPVHFFI